MGSVRREEPCRSIYSRSLSSPSPRCRSHPLVSFRHGADCTLQCSAVSSRTYSGSLSLQMSFSLAQYHQKSVNENKRECKAYGWEIYATLTYVCGHPRFSRSLNFIQIFYFTSFRLLLFLIRQNGFDRKVQGGDRGAEFGTRPRAGIQTLEAQCHMLERCRLFSDEWSHKAQLWTQLTHLGWIEMAAVSQTPSPNISSWPPWCSCVWMAANACSHVPTFSRKTFQNENCKKRTNLLMPMI